MNVLAADDGASTANQSSVSVATDMSSPALMLRTRIPRTDGGVSKPIPVTDADASLTILDSQQ